MPDPDLNYMRRNFLSSFRLFTQLVRDELALARTEIAENLSRARVGIALLCVAAVLALVALNLLALAVVAGLNANGLPFWAAALIVGGALLLVALLFAIFGKSRLGSDALKPKRTMANVKRDIDYLKDATNV